MTLALRLAAKEAVNHLFKAGGGEVGKVHTKNEKLYSGKN